MDTRTDSGQFYPGGKVLPRQPGGGGGGGTVVLDDTVTATSSNGVKSSGIWSWVKSLLPSWLTASREEPPTQESIVGKRPVKPLPKYLHYLSFDDTYPADAEAWYESLSPDEMGGACSAVRRGGKLYRNYDWTFDSAAEFVVRMSAAEGRHASVGVASLGAALTEDEVMSGVYSPKYRALPGMTLDGINDAGVVCEINVDGGPKTGWHGDADEGGIHILAAVRWVLDHGETAQQAAEWIADHIIQPTGEMNFHFMVADATKTYIVENGVAHDVTNGTKVLTNYGVFDMAQAGGGKERYDLLADGADISAVNWTNAYQPGNDWHSDFESEAQHAAAIEQWAAQGADREAHRGKTTTSGKPWWQTVHTSEYDFAARTLRVAVQESGEYFTFAAMAPVAQSQVTGLDATLAAKRDLSNRQWFGTPVMTGGAVFDGFRFISNIAIWAADFHTTNGSYYCYIGDEKPADDWAVIGPIPDWNVNTVSGDEWTGGDITITREVTNLALDSETDAKLAGKVDAVSGKGLSTNDYDDAAVAKVDGKRDRDDLFVRCWSSQSGEVGLMKPISRDSSGNFRWSDGVHILVFNKDSSYHWQITGGDLGDAAEGSITDTTISFENIGLTLTESNLNIALSGLDDDGVPTDPNVRDWFSESNTLFKRGVRYAHSTFAFGSGEKLKDRAINALTFTASSASHTFDLAAALPTATDGFVRDFLVRLVSDAKVTFVTDEMDIRGDGLAMEDGAADMLITLTEVATSGVWYVRSIDITAQTEA